MKRGYFKCSCILHHLRMQLKETWYMLECRTVMSRLKLSKSKSKLIWIDTRIVLLDHIRNHHHHQSSFNHKSIINVYMLNLGFWQNRVQLKLWLKVKESYCSARVSLRSRISLSHPLILSSLRPASLARQTHLQPGRNQWSQENIETSDQEATSDNKHWRHFTTKGFCKDCKL